VLSLHAIHYTSNIHFRSCTWSHSTHMHNSLKTHTPFFILHVFLTPNPLPDHHNNSSSSLVVILNLFIISGHYPKIIWLLWQSQLFVFSVKYSQSFWLLWLLSPFLHMIIRLTNRHFMTRDFENLGMRHLNSPKSRYLKWILVTCYILP
jgi:hypothetical protein